MKKVLIVLLSLFVFANIQANAYGFGFKKNNNHVKPDIGKYQEILDNTDSYYVGSDEKIIYLTFDAGYDNGVLSSILKTLSDKNIKATFFVTGDFLNREQDLVFEILNNNHLIGNHTYGHKNITKLSNDNIINEIKKLEDKYKEITGKEMPKLFRPPEGEFDKRSLEVVKSMGYKTFFWSVAYDDWNTNNQKGASYGYNKVMSNIHNGAIILLHTVSKDNAEALPKIIDDLKYQGYVFKGLDEFYA